MTTEPASADTPVRMDIDYVADVACPWCYVGWLKLKRTLQLRPQVDGQIRWRPYQLHPELPDEGMDRQALMRARFGEDPDRLKPVHDALISQAAQEGVTLRLDEVEKSPNTNAAHRLIVWAELEGCGPPVAEAVMRAYWSELRDVGDHQVLADIGAAHGMDREALLRRYRDGAGRDFVNQACDAAARSGVQGVPFMIFAGRVAVSGAHAPEDLVKAVDKALEPG